MANAKLKYPEWQQQYYDALLELDHIKLEQLIAAARAAIVERQQIVASLPERQAERQALEDALISLRVLKTKEVDST